MKKFYLIVAALTVILSSCGGRDSNSVTLIIEPQLGEIGNFISINDNDLTVSLKEEKEEGEDVKSIVSSFTIQVTNGIQTDSSIGFEFMVLDKDHNQISRLPSCYIHEEKFDWNNEPYHHILVPGNYRLQIHESQSLEDWKEDNSQEYWDKIRKEGKFVEIKISSSYLKFAPYTSMVDVNESTSADNTYNSINRRDDEEVEAFVIEDDEDSNQSVSSPSPKDNSALLSEFNEALNEYKSLTKEAIALSKKVKAGDQSANVELVQKSAECTKLSTKILDMANKLDDPTLVAKYQKINLEYMNGLK